MLRSRFYLIAPAILLSSLLPSTSFHYLRSFLKTAWTPSSVYSVTSQSTPMSSYKNLGISSLLYSHQPSRLAKQSPISNGSSLTYDGILQVIRAFRAGQVSSPRSDSNTMRSRPFLSSNAALATIGTMVTSSGQITLTSNSTNVFRYLLKSSIKFKYIDHVLAISSILLEYECMTSHDFIDVLGFICEERSHAEGLALLDEAVSYNIDLNTHLFSPLLKACGNAKNARKVLQRMEFFGFSPNVISFTTAIKSCEGTGDWKGALELVSLMKAVGVSPNERTYACVISAASRGLAADVALNMLNEMTLNDFPPNMICYGSALTACARCKMWPEVDVLMTQMVKNHMMLNQSVLSSVINVCRGQINRGSNSDSATIAQNSMAGQLSSGDDVAPVDDGATDSVCSEVTNELDSDTLIVSPEIPIKSDVQWERAVYLLNKWSEFIQGKNESLYTLVMGICETAGKHVEVTDVYFKMIRDGIHATRNSCRFALRACVAGNLPEVAVRVVQHADTAGVTKSFMLTETIAMCERNGRHDCTIELVEWIMKARFFNVPNARLRSIITASLRAYFFAYDSARSDGCTEDMTAAYGVPPSRDTLARVLRCILTERMSAFMPTDSYGLAARLLYMAGDITSLRILLRDSLALPTFQAPVSSFFASRESNDTKNGRVSLFVNVIGFILYKRTQNANSESLLADIEDNESENEIEHDRTVTSVSEDETEDTRYPDVRDIDLILELLKDLCAAGHSRRVADLLVKIVKFYLKGYVTNTTRVNNQSEYAYPAQSSFKTMSQSAASSGTHSSPDKSFKIKVATKGKSSGHLAGTPAGQENLTVITIAAASDTDMKLRRLELERDRARALHHLLREGRRAINAYPHPVPLPNSLYKLLAQVYKDANLVEFLSEVFKFASEDNAVDRQLRELVISSLSSGNTPGGSNIVGG